MNTLWAVYISVVIKKSTRGHDFTCAWFLWLPYTFWLDSSITTNHGLLPNEKGLKEFQAHHVIPPLYLCSSSSTSQAKYLAGHLNGKAVAYVCLANRFHSVSNCIFFSFPSNSERQFKLEKNFVGKKLISHFPQHCNLTDYIQRERELSQTTIKTCGCSWPVISLWVGQCLDKSTVPGAPCKVPEYLKLFSIYNVNVGLVWEDRNRVFDIQSFAVALSPSGRQHSSGLAVHFQFQDGQ